MPGGTEALLVAGQEALGAGESAAARGSFEAALEYLPRLTDRLQQLLPNAERIEVTAASHLMNEENPRMVNDAILSFLARQ